MAKIKLKGNPIHTNGALPQIGMFAKDFTLVKSDLTRVTLEEYKGKNIVMNIFPSIDTGTCASSVRRFNKIAGDTPDTVVLCISRDLPFAQARFCGAEGLNNVITLSDYENGEFGKTYGVEMIDGPLKGLHSRAVVIVNKEGLIAYTEQVDDIVNEPNYDKALEAIK